MKTLIVIALATAFCLPAYAEVLVFQTSTSGQQLDVSSSIVERKSERGYLVINVDLSNPDSVTTSKANFLHYEKKGKSKIQYTTILNPGNMEFIFVNYGNNKKMVLRWFDDPTGTYTVVQGVAAAKDIGGLQRYIASSVSGNSVWREQDFRTGFGSINLKLNIKATQLANTQNKTVEQIINEYEQALELTKGYIPE